jgi:hypothetical protein
MGSIRLARRVAALSLALVVATGLSSSATAQGRSAEDTRRIESYRLTMPMLRKVLPAVYGRTCERRRDLDPSALGLAEMTRMLEACAPVAQSLRQAGLTSGDAALLLAALLNASRRVALQGGKASALPPGVVRDNALLLEQNDPEIRKLIESGGQS